MKPLHFVSIVLIAVSFSAIGAYVLVKSNQVKQAYVLNQKIFDAFEGTKELKEKLGQLHASNLRSLDSIASSTTISDADYEKISRNNDLQEQRLSEQYTSDIWKQINQYVEEYGKSNSYDYIMGAVGDGNMMFASSRHDITDEMIIYINKRYEGGH